MGYLIKGFDWRRFCIAISGEVSVVLSGSTEGRVVVEYGTVVWLLLRGALGGYFESFIVFTIHASLTHYSRLAFVGTLQ